MVETRIGSSRPLRVLHVLRAPVGGLFRHVIDLAREQVRRGHEVGLVTDSTTGGETAHRLLSELAPSLALGLSRRPMRRDPHLTDLDVLAHVGARVRETAPDVIHGHGSKGGAYARFARLWPSSSGAIRVYTPHGGSLNHKPGTLTGRGYMRAEALMAKRTDLLLFESAFIGARYRQLVGEPRCLSRVVHNGIGEKEFVRVQRRAEAADFVYVGELRAAKGIDTLLEALAATGQRLGFLPRAVLVGSGPDEALLTQYVRKLGLEEQVTFAGPLPGRVAFERGKILVVPSRAESLPYVVLEAAGAQVPMIATNVGGIPEIFGPFRNRLLPPDDADGLAARMFEALSATDEQRAGDAADLARFVHDGFSIDAMVDAVVGAYRDALARRSESIPATPSKVAISS